MTAHLQRKISRLNNMSNTKTKLKERIEENSALTECALKAYLSLDDKDYGVLYEAMRYSAMAAGKRIRPFLAIEFCRLFGADVEKVMPFACALEMIHNYSLIHDDLPCMDNDDLRRGRPTNHKVYGEAKALLAGDALLTYAFEVAASGEKTSDSVKVKAISTLSQCAGGNGMIGGQWMDLDGEQGNTEFEKLKRLHSLKTGRLIECAAKLGVYAAGVGKDEEDAAVRYAKNIGLAFQIIDDILDVTSDNETLGKPCGSDKEQNKTTFMTFMSVDEAYGVAEECTKSAIEAIEKYENSQILVEFAKYLLERKK